MPKKKLKFGESEKEGSRYDIYSLIRSSFEEERLVPTISVETMERIEEGDPDHIGKMLYYKTLFSVSTEIAWEAALNNPYWTGNFKGGAEANSTFDVPLSNDKLFLGMKSVFTKQYQFIELFIKDIQKIQTPYSEEERERIITAAKLLSKFSETDYKYFDKWQKSKNGGVRLKVTFENLDLCIGELERFREEKFEILNELTENDEEGEIESFQVYFGIDEKEKARFEELKDKLYNIPGDLLERYTSLTKKGFDYRRLLLGFGVASAMEVKDSIAEYILVKDLEKSGYNIDTLIDFTYSFRERAILKAFEMLDENKKRVNEETEHYKDHGELNKLVSKIRRYTGSFNDSELLRARALVAFIKEEVGNNKSFFVDFLKKTGVSGVFLEILGQDESIKNIAEGLRKIRPNELLKILGAYKQFKNSTSLNFIARNPIEEIYNDTRYSGFKEADKKDLETLGKIHGTESEGFPVLKDVSIDFRTLSRKSGDEIKSEITETILPQKIKHNDSLRGKLIGDPDKVWELEGVIALAKEEYGIEENTAPDKLINDQITDISDGVLWRNIGLGAVGIALGIAGFFTAGSTWAPAALIIAGIGVSGLDLYLTLEEYNFRADASDTAFSDAKELSMEAPDMLGVVLSVIGLIIDAADVIKLLKAGKLIGAGSSALSYQKLQGFFKRLAKEEDVEKVAGEIYDILGKSKIGIGTTREKFIDRIVEGVGKAKNKDPEFLKFISSQSEAFKKMPRLIQTGLHDLHKTDKSTFEFIIKNLGNQEKLMYKMSIDLLLNPEYATGLKLIKELPGMSDEALVKIYRYYGGAFGRRSVEGLKGLAIEIGERAKITDPKLLEQVFTSSKLKKSLLDNPNEPEYFNKLWSEYQQGKGNGLSFEKYVGKVETTRLNKIQKIGGRYPSNAQEFAGRTFSFDLDENIVMRRRLEADLKSEKITQAEYVQKISEFKELRKKYPNGVKFNDKGFPDFSPYVVTPPKGNGIENIKTIGDYSDDFRKADKAAGINKKYRVEHGLTWHHHEDTERMLLVPQDLHDATRHSGGISITTGSVEKEGY